MKFWRRAAIIALFMLTIAVLFNYYAWNIFIILSGGLMASMAMAWVSVHLMETLIYYYVDRSIRSGRVLTRNLASVVGTQHQLSQTELHKIAVQLRRDLADVWMFRTAMDEAKIKRGLTSITDDSSQITHFEFERIKWLFKRGQKKLRKTRFALMTILIFSGFIAGCIVGVYLQNEYHFLK